jgi:hypothetical protein
MFAWIRGFRGPGVSNTSGGASVTPQLPAVQRQKPTASRRVWVGSLVAAAGGGKYTGVICQEPTGTPSLTGNLAVADVATLPATGKGFDCVVFNTTEVGQNTHDLTAGSVQVTVFPGTVQPNRMSDGRPVVRIGGYDWKACT